MQKNLRFLLPQSVRFREKKNVKDDVRPIRSVQITGQSDGSSFLNEVTVFQTLKPENIHPKRPNDNKVGRWPDIIKSKARIPERKQPKVAAQGELTNIEKLLAKTS